MQTTTTDSNPALAALRSYTATTKAAKDILDSIAAEAKEAADAAAKAVRDRRAPELDAANLAREEAASVWLAEARAVARSLAGQHVLTFTTAEKVSSGFMGDGKVRDDLENYEAACSCGFNDVPDYGTALRLPYNWRGKVHRGQVVAFCDDEFEHHVAQAVAEAIGEKQAFRVEDWRTTLTVAMVGAENEAAEDEAAVGEAA